MKIVILIILITLCGGMLLIPRDSNIRFQHLGVKDGLSMSNTTAFLQDSRGFLWIGTSNGLNRYDGYGFKIFRRQTDNPNSISSDFIWTIYEDSDGITWIGTSWGLNRYDPATEKFTRYYYDPDDPNSLGANLVTKITQDKTGNIWCATANGVARLDKSSGKFSRFLYTPPREANNVQSYSLRTLHMDNEGMLWLGAIGRGLVRLDPASGKTTGFLPQPRVLPERSRGGKRFIKEIYAPEVEKDILWLAMVGEIWKFDTKKLEYIGKSSSKEPVFQISSNISDIDSPDGGKTLWLSTYLDGLYRYDTAGKTLTHLVPDPGNPDSLSSNLIHRLMFDRTGSLWVGTDKGVDKYDKHSQRFGRERILPRNQAGAAFDASVNAIYKDRQGVLWIGTKGGLYHRSPGDDRFSPYPLIDKTKLLSMEPKAVIIIAIQEDYLGRLWIGTRSHGLFRVDPMRRSITPIPLHSTSKNAVAKLITAITTIGQDAGGFTWVGTQVGLFRFHPSNDSYVSYLPAPGDKDSISSLYISKIYLSPSGNLWIATIGGGINLFQPNRNNFKSWKVAGKTATEITRNTVFSVLEDKTGMIWIGSWSGLSRLDPGSGQYEHFDETGVLPHSPINGLLMDEWGFLWISTNMGISYYNPVTGASRNYDLHDGLQDYQFSRGAAFKSSDGQLYFGGIDGYNAFYPGHISDNPHIPPVVFTSFKILNKTVQPGPHSHLKQSIIATRKLVLSHKDYTFSLEFAALDFTSPSKNRYKYKLEGLDHDWIDLGNKHEVTFSTLPPGDYTLKVKGSNNDGVWNEAEASLKITVTPPFWRTWWFRGIAVLLLASGVLAWHRKTMQIQEMKLKAEAAMNRFLDKFNFTGREEQIIKLIIDGKSNKEIENELSLSLQTVKNYISRIYKKAGVKSRFELQSLLNKLIRGD